MNDIKTRIEESKVYLGGGTYKALQPVITPAGRQAGWIYIYRLGINKDGINFTQLGETLDTLEAAGMIELREQTITAC